MVVNLVHDLLHMIFTGVVIITTHAGVAALGSQLVDGALVALELDRVSTMRAFVHEAVHITQVSNLQVCAFIIMKV